MLLIRVKVLLLIREGCKIKGLKEKKNRNIIKKLVRMSVIRIAIFNQINIKITCKNTGFIGIRYFSKVGLKILQENLILQNGVGILSQQ